MIYYKYQAMFLGFLYILNSFLGYINKILEEKLNISIIANLDNILMYNN